MTVLVDINVLLDVFQNRQPHYSASAAVVDAVRAGLLRGICPSHGVATLFYLMQKQSTTADASAAVDNLLQHFEVIGLDTAEWKAARQLPIADLEDAAVARTAVLAQAAFIITRNEVDFSASSVNAMTPFEFVKRFLPPP